VPKAPSSTHGVQAAAEGADLLPAAVDGRQTVTFCGEQYAIADDVADFAVWKYARVMDDGASGIQRLAAQHTLLQECIAPDEWSRFSRYALAKKASGADLMGVCEQVLEMLAARPTQRPNDSSTGPLPTSENSKESSLDEDTRYPGTVSVDSLLGR
jgi:hypothetical protein